MRLNIALRNLVISQLIILLFLVFAYFVWFPHSFLELGGFTRTAFMLIFADLILGPLLVFIVFKEGKKYLKFDINVLLSIQIIAFLFGAHSLYLKHPAYAVFKHDRFILTNVSHLYPQPGLQEQLTKTVFSKPQLVTTRLPENMAERMNLMVNVDLFGAPDIEKRPKYYAPVTDDLSALLQKSLHIENILADKNTKNKLQAFIKQHGGKASDYAYFPLSGNNKKQVIWVLDRNNAEPVGIIDSNPWAIKPIQQKRIHTARL